MLAARSFRVIRFDNRDSGLSSDLDNNPIPNFASIAAQIARGEPPYSALHALRHRPGRRVSSRCAQDQARAYCRYVDGRHDCPTGGGRESRPLPLHGVDHVEQREPEAAIIDQPILCPITSEKRGTDS